MGLIYELGPAPWVFKNGLGWIRSSHGSTQPIYIDYQNKKEEKRSGRDGEEELNRETIKSKP